MQLFFPICYEEHWSIFVVDIKDKKYVILDSFFSMNDEYQEFLRDKMVSCPSDSLFLFSATVVYVSLFWFVLFLAFYLCLQRSSFERYWYKYVQYDMDFDDFEFIYPVVPQQPLDNKLVPCLYLFPASIILFLL